MADSPVISPPAPETPTAVSPSNVTSPPTPPPSSNSAPPPNNNNSSASSPPPAPPTQETAPPPPSPSTSPPEVSNPPPQTPENPSPPSPEGSTPVTPPAPPQTPSNQSPPSQRPSPPSPGANDERNRTNGNNGNNRDGSTPSPPSGNRTSGDGGSPSPPRSISSPRSGRESDSSLLLGDHNPQANIGLIIGVLVGAGILLLLLVLICMCCKKKKKKQSPQVNHMHYYNNNPFGAPTGNGVYYNNGTPQDHVVNMAGQGGGNWGPQQPVSGPHSDTSNLTGRTGATPSPSAVTLGHNQSTFTYDELSIATEGFSESNLLGQGGFGYVHKGVLPSGKEVAVKSLKLGSGQGEREFQAEVEIISRVHHRHLVSLVGYCISGGKRLLVYEFLPNNTLEFHLHGKGRPVMDWSTRVKIALGSARGLAYLHEDCHPRIIHRDIKAANILLDFSFETQVADFGLAKLSQDNYTHVSTRVMGTFGYLAPEYASSGKLSDKSDVFSFGVMLLELITGRTPVDLTGEMEDSLVDWARPLCLKAAQDGDYSQLADPRLETNFDQQEMARMASCAAAAIRHSARRRPKMSQIVRALEGDVSMDDISEGARAGQNTYSSPGGVSSEYDASSYSADMKKIRKLALETKEYQSSEYGGTSEYGLNPSASSSEEMHRSSMKRNPQL
ncbi:Proline-rich receptor-like protein kinase PERK5 [Cardamine amara subsp. amara]|uniref:non-specific serine/threonine protein kinase n=1 Tax=Cardamine amara subsp. amara TaxID=228776 RepID=A0ABD1BIZ8_CARAN